MHPAHKLFVSRPTFCELDELFALLDEFDVVDRHSVLGPLYQQFFRSTPFQVPPGTTDEQGMELAYAQFKELVVALAVPVHYAFIINGIVTTTLVWLHGSSDETLINDFIASNRESIESERRRFESGEITEQELEHVLGEIEERMNNLRSDMSLRRQLYERFCDDVVARLPNRRS